MYQVYVYQYLHNLEVTQRLQGPIAGLEGPWPPVEPPTRGYPGHSVKILTRNKPYFKYGYINFRNTISNPPTGNTRKSHLHLSVYVTL